jgi:hypothetical protein
MDWPREGSLPSSSQHGHPSTCKHIEMHKERVVRGGGWSMHCVR